MNVLQESTPKKRKTSSFETDCISPSSKFGSSMRRKNIFTGSSPMRRGCSSSDSSSCSPPRDTHFNSSTPYHQSSHSYQQIPPSSLGTSQKKPPLPPSARTPMKLLVKSNYFEAPHARTQPMRKNPVRLISPPQKLNLFGTYNHTSPARVNPLNLYQSGQQKQWMQVAMISSNLLNSHTSPKLPLRNLFGSPIRSPAATSPYDSSKRSTQAFSLLLQSAHKNDDAFSPPRKANRTIYSATAEGMKSSQQFPWVQFNKASPSLSPFPSRSLFADDNRFESDYEVIKSLGSGCFGTVYKCRHKVDGNLYAVKITHAEIKGENSQREILKEAQALAALSACEDQDGEYIVRYSSAWIEDKQLHLAMEYCDASLADKKRCLMMTNDHTGFLAHLHRLFTHVSRGLNYLHRQSLVHLDLKPENILFSERQAKFKIADLGLALIASKTGQSLNPVFQVQEGDSRYLAKEVLNYYSAIDLRKADIFSFGITIYHILISEDLPQNGEEWHAIRKGELPKLDQLKDCPNELKELLKAMMHIDPEMRPSAKELVESAYVKKSASITQEVKWQRMRKRFLVETIKVTEELLLAKKGRTLSS